MQRMQRLRQEMTRTDVETDLRVMDLHAGQPCWATGETFSSCCNSESERPAGPLWRWESNRTRTLLCGFLKVLEID